MPLTATYTTGTISVAANGTTVTGAGTNWLAGGVRPGDILAGRGLTVTIREVTSATTLALATTWPGTALSASPYEIRYTPDATRVLASSREAIAAMESLRGDVFVSANVYASPAAGLAATTPGQQFQTISVNGENVVRYRHDPGGVATEVARYPTASAVDAAVAQATSAATTAADQVRAQVAVEADRAVTAAASVSEAVSDITRLTGTVADIPVEDLAFALVDPGGRRLWLGARDDTGGPDSYATKMMGDALGVASHAAPKIMGEEITFAVAVEDADGVPRAGELVLDANYQVPSYILDRWRSRMGLGGPVDTNVATLRADPYPPRLRWSQARAMTRHLSGTQALAGVIDTTLNGEPVRLRLPAGYSDAQPVIVVIALEGTDRFSQAGGYDPRGDLAAVPDAAGVAWLSGRWHGNSYGNADAMADVRAAYEWATSQISVSAIVLFGNSMGGVAALNAVQRDVVPGVIGIYLTDPVTNLYQRFSAGSGSAMTNVRTAYGIAADSEYAAKTAGFDPMATEWWRFRGLPMVVRGAATDTTVPFAQHGIAFANKLALHNDMTVQDLQSGGHGATNRFLADPMIAFINRCAGGPTLYGG